LANIAIVPDEAHIERLASEEAVFGRLLSYRAVSTSVKNILGSNAHMFLSDWKPEKAAKEFPLRRTTAWDSGLATKARSETPRPFKMGEGQPPPELLDADGLKHGDQQVLSLIDVPLWNQANWEATAYLYADPGAGAPPMLALVFENAEAAKTIFARWHRELGRIDEKEKLRIAVVTGLDRNHPSHYAVVVGPNLPQYAQGSAGDRIVMISRINRMTPSSTRNLDAFLRNLDGAKRYVLLPAHFSGPRQPPEIFPELGIGKREIVVRPAWQLSENDPDLVALDLDTEPVVPPGVVDPPVLKALAQRRRMRHR
jgi:hypothetical protein